MFNKLRLNRIIMAVICLVIAWGLKYHYSHSSSDDLVWILAPTAYLVEMTGDMDFERETDTGYVNNENGIIIAPSCSGVNFMIIAFCLSVYIGLKNIKSASMQNLWVFVSLVSAYAYTLFVNIFRINLSIYSIKTKLLETWFTRETVHLFEGVLVYFIFLLIYNSLLNRIMDSDHKETSKKPFIPLGRFLLPLSFYLSFTLVVPVLNHGGIPQNSDFIGFALIVLSGCAIVFTLFFLLKACCHYVSVRVK